MKGKINFQYCSLSLLIRDVTYRLQLVSRSSHLRLSLVYKIIHQRPLRGNNALFEIGNKNKRNYRKNTANFYYIPTTNDASYSSDQSKKLSESNLRKVYVQLGHVTATQITKFHREENKWEQAHGGMISEIANKCLCALASSLHLLLSARLILT